MTRLRSIVQRHRGSLSVIAVSLILTLLVATWMGYDLRELPSGLIANRAGDTQLNSWIVYQALDNLLHRPADLGYSPIFYGDTNSFAYTIAPYGIAVVVLPVYVLSGGNLELTYNLYFLATFVLTAWAAYLLIAYLLRPPLIISLFASLLVSFAQFRFLHYMHIETLSTQFYLLALYCLHRLIDRPKIRWAIGLGVLAWLTFATSGNHSVNLIVTAATLALFVFVRHRAALTPRLLGLLALTAIGFGIALWPLVSFRLGNPVFARGYDLGEIITYSSLPIGWIVGNSLVYRLFSPFLEEKTLFIGLTPLALSIVAWRQRRHADKVIAPLPTDETHTLTPREVVILYAIVIVVGYVCTLGPGYPVGNIFVPLPYLALAKLPLFSSVRVASRYIMLPILGTAILSAYALSYLSKLATPRRFRLFLAIVAAFAVFELFPSRSDAGPNAPRYFASLPPIIDTSAYDWVKRLPTGTPILEYPYESDGTHFIVQQQRFHRHPILNGKGSYSPSWLYLFVSPNFPTAAAITFIRGRGIPYLLVHNELLSEAERATLAANMARLSPLDRPTFVRSMGQIDIYQIPFASLPF